MAERSENDNGHGQFGSPFGQLMLASVGLAIGMLVTFATASIYLGGTFERVNSLIVRQDALQHRIDQIDQSGSLRQIEINTARLTQLESSGSPQVQTIKEALSNESLRVQQLERITNSLPSVDAATQRDLAILQGSVSQNKEMIAQLTKDLRPREYWEKLSASVSTLDQQVKELFQTRDQGVVQWATIVQRVAAMEMRANAIEENVKNLRERSIAHERDDMDQLRDRAKGVRVPGKLPD